MALEMQHGLDPSGADVSRGEALWYCTTTLSTMNFQTKVVLQLVVVV